MTRREALRNLTLWAAGSPLLRAQQDISYTPERTPALTDLVNVLEFEPVAKAKLPAETYDFVAGGVDDEWTLRRNREAFQWIMLRPRMLAGVSRLDLSLELFGQKIEMPILVSPTGGQGLSHPEGELAMARGAGQVKTIMCVSTNSTYPIDKIAGMATGPLWFQLYPGEDREASRERVERAVAAGCKAVAFTVDTPYDSHRERLLRHRAGGPGPAALTTRRRQERQLPSQYRLNRRPTAELTWPFVEELNSYAKVPVLVKGVLAPEDALLAVKHGAAGIIVSNHGGRYLNFAPSTIEALPGIVDAVAGKIPVLIDGGFRRGTDIIKALAIGAEAVMVGRPPLWGLAGYGQPGVVRVMELLQSELALAMGLSGRPTLASLDRSLVSFPAR